MLRRTLLLSTIAILLAGCGKKTEAEKQEEEREKLRAEKRDKAIQAYKDISTKFPEHERAKAAADKAKALEAAKPK